jgi:hypothetical protein
MRDMNDLTVQRVRRLKEHLVAKPEATNPVCVGSLC